MAILVLAKEISFSGWIWIILHFLKISKKLFPALISPVCLPLNEPERSKNYVGFNPFAAGWGNYTLFAFHFSTFINCSTQFIYFLGRTQEGGASANVLQEIQLPVIANNECKDAYAAIGKNFSRKQFDDAVMCAGYKEGGRDTCNG